VNANRLSCSFSTIVVYFGFEKAPKWSRGHLMPQREEYRQEIADLTARIATGDERITLANDRIHVLRTEGRPTFALLMKLSGLQRVQEHRRGMLATLEQHRLLIQSS
jgi:hypothetical protein